MLGLISAGLGLVGSLFGKKKAEKTTTESTVDYVKMAKSAEAAGFNPLTALRNGGSAGFTSSTTSHPGLSSNADIGASLGQFGSALAGYFDPVAKKQRQVESALLDYQLQTIQSKPKARMMFGDVPTRRAAAAQYQAKAGLASGSKAAPARILTPTPLGGSSGGWFDPPPAGTDDLPIWVPGRDRDGKRVWIPNPDGPDIDQALYAWLTRSQVGAEVYAKTLYDAIASPKTVVRTRKATSAERKEAESSWHRGYLPQFKLSW